MFTKKVFVVAGVFLWAFASSIAIGASAQSSSKESASSKAADEKAAKTQAPEKDANYFLLTGTALHQDGSAWEGLEVILLSLDKKKQSSAFYAFGPTGSLELANPHAKTDAKGRFAIKVHRGYLEKDTEETEFRVGYNKPVPAGAVTYLVEMGKKGSKDPLTLKIKKDVKTLELGEIW